MIADHTHPYSEEMFWGSGSGSGRIGIILLDPDRDRHPGPADPVPVSYPFQSKVKHNYIFYIISVCWPKY